MSRLSLVIVGSIAALSMACSPEPAPQAPAPAGPAAPAGAAKLELRLVVQGAEPGQAFPTDDGKSLTLEAKPVVTGADVAKVEANGTEVLLTLTPAGAKALQDATARNVGRKLAILVGGVVNSAPEIKSTIEDGRAKVTLRSPKEADDLARALSAKP